VRVNKVLAVEPLEAAKPRGEWGGVFLAASQLALGGSATKKTSILACQKYR